VETNGRKTKHVIKVTVGGKTMILENIPIFKLVEFAIERQLLDPSRAEGISPVGCQSALTTPHRAKCREAQTMYRQTTCQLANASFKSSVWCLRLSFPRTLSSASGPSANNGDQPSSNRWLQCPKSAANHDQWYDRNQRAPRQLICDLRGTGFSSPVPLRWRCDCIP